MNQIPDAGGGNPNPAVSPGEPGAGPRRMRRRLLQSLSVAPIGKGLLAGGAGLGMGVVPAIPLAATPGCGDAAVPTQRQTEGPYFTRNSPLRGSLLQEDMAGTRLVLSGAVRGLDCAVLRGVVLDFWQADSDGVYDNRGYRLRGHQFTDATGRYRLETVLPGFYPGRTRHIHVKVQSPEGPVLTTQLYFPGEAHNRKDRIFSPALLVLFLPSDGPAGSASAGSGPATSAGQGPAFLRSAPSGTIHASFDFAIRTA